MYSNSGKVDQVLKQRIYAFVYPHKCDKAMNREGHGFNQSGRLTESSQLVKLTANDDRPASGASTGALALPYSVRKQAVGLVSWPFSVKPALSIADLLTRRNFPALHACTHGSNVHRRQSLRWWWIRFWIEMMKSMGSREPDTTIPHDW